MQAVDLGLAGIALGSIAALSGIGLLVTYRTNGVLNLAHGGIATLAAYLFRQFVVVWGWPMAVAAPLLLVVIAPAFGLLLERAVFRPLANRRASAAESLVASLGLFVLCIGIAFAIWGSGTRQDAPSLFPSDAVHLWGNATIRTDALAELGLVLAICVGFGLVAARTTFGRQVRAVVDDRQLAELTAVPADDVASIGWATGSALAALTGVLLAPRLGLDPYGLTLVVLETFAVVVAARLSSFTIAVVTALVLGIGQSELELLHPTGDWLTALRNLQANLFVAALFVLLLVVPRLRELGGDAGATGRFSSRGAPHGRAPLQRVQAIGSALLLLVPLLLSSDSLQAAFRLPALGLIFLSLVIVTGYSGQVSLGVAGYAGLGALFAADLAQGTFLGIPKLPGLAAILVGALLVGPVGFVSGYPAIRRRGLALALTTFAVGAVVSRFVFESPTFVSGLFVERPTILGRAMSDRWFYVLELLFLALGLVLVRNLHRGRLGRALLAVRDAPDGAAAVGVDTRVLKLLSFTVSGVVAGLGGALLTQASGSFDGSTFDPLQSLLWFTAVVVFGADSAAGAVAAAALIVTIDTATADGNSTLAIGLLALALGRLPGGLAGGVRRLAPPLQRLSQALLAPPGSPVLVGTAGPARPAGHAGTVAATGSSSVRAVAAVGQAAPAASVAAGNGAAVPDLAVRTADGRVLRPTAFGRALLTRIGSR